jgi:heptosyltransferase-3
MLRAKENRRKILYAVRLLPSAFWRILLAQRTAKKEGKKIHLILHPGALGDLIAAEPAARVLVSADTCLVWLVNPQYAPLLHHIPWLDGVIPIAGYTEWNLLKFFFRGVKTSTFYPDGSPCPWLGVKISNPNRFGLNIENYYDEDSLQSAYSKIGVGIITDTTPRLYLNPECDFKSMHRKVSLDIGSSFVVLTCQTTSPERNWSEFEFQNLINWLIDNTRLSIVEVGLNPVLAPHFRIIQPRAALPIDQQVHILNRARLFVGVDSGFSHIANALNVPSVIVMGKYRHWTNHNPFSGAWAKGSGCTIIRSEGHPDKVSAKQVISEILKILKVDEFVN